MLEEYFFEDWHKIRLILGDNQKPEVKQFIIETKLSFSELFGTNSGLDEYETENTRFEVASFVDSNSSWNDTDSYIGIYDTSSISGAEA